MIEEGGIAGFERFRRVLDYVRTPGSGPRLRPDSGRVPGSARTLGVVIDYAKSGRVLGTTRTPERVLDCARTPGKVLG